MVTNIQNKILEMIASSTKANDILASLCKMAEELLPNSVASIMMQDTSSGLLSVLSAPSIPKAGQDALKNLKPGPTGGSCGNAVFHNEAQYVSDTFSDVRWESLKRVAYDFNICSCWSMPVLNKDAKAIGTFALSSFEHRSPAAFHKQLLQTAASIVSIVLKNQENEEDIEFFSSSMKNAIYMDSLTALANKTKLDELIDTQKEQTLILINVNNFSYINTVYGFDIGDKLLIKVAQILKGTFEEARVFRINADEFGFLFEGKINIKSKVREIKNYFYSQELTLDTIKLNISFTYGACSVNVNLLRNASSALKNAKQSGRNNLHIFDEKASESKDRESFIESNHILYRALSEDKIVPYYQGIRDNLTKKITKFEVLARIEIDGEVISPFRFLEPAKISGLLPEITKIMIDKSFKKMSKHAYTFSINITEEDLTRDYLVDYLEEKSSQYSIHPNRVILEILEGVSSDGKKNHISQLSNLKEKGYALAIDDFGSEYSNFERVLDLEIDFLKIDARYIKDINTNKKSYEITRAIVFFAKNAQIPCIAEFVHDGNVQAVIDELDINFSQGYYFSQPKAEPIS